MSERQAALGLSRKQKFSLALRNDRLAKQISYLSFIAVIIIIGLTLAFFNGYIVWPFNQVDKANSLELAIVEFQRAIELEPNNAEAYHYLNSTYKLAGNVPEGIAFYQRVRAARPDQAWPRIGLGQLYLEMKNIEAARTEFTAAVEVEPDNADAYINLAQLYLNQSDGQETALDLYRQAAEFNPGQAWPYLNLANTYLAVGQPEQALSALQEAIIVEPQNAEIYAQLGNFYQWQKNQPQQAITYYRQATALVPQSGGYQLAFAWALFAADQTEEGMRRLEIAHRLEPVSSPIQQSIGELMLQYRSPEMARPYFEQALKLDPRNGDAALGLSRVYRQQKNYSQALNYAQQALALAEDSERMGQAHMELGLVYQAQQKPAEAEEHFLKASRALPDNHWVQATVGNFYQWQQQQPEQAVAFYRQAVELKPDVAWYHVHLGTALFAVGQQREALQELETGLLLAKDDVNIYLVLGSLASDQHAWTQAIQIYEQAVAQGIENADIYIQLGDAYWMIGEPDRAMAQYRKAVSLAPDRPELQQRLHRTS